jgi:hypothetical protein
MSQQQTKPQPYRTVLHARPYKAGSNDATNIIDLLPGEYRTVVKKQYPQGPDLSTALVNVSGKIVSAPFVLLFFFARIMADMMMSVMLRQKQINRDRRYADSADSMYATRKTGHGQRQNTSYKITVKKGGHVTINNYY